MKKLFSLLAVTCLLATTCFAQKAVVGQPYSFTHSDISYSIDKAVLPSLDVDKLYREDALNVKNGTPLRVGYVHHVGYTFSNSGRTDILSDGARLWRLSISSKDAVMLDIFFSKFNIPEGAQFHIYSGDRTQLTGTYTSKDIQENGVLAAEDIVGDEAILEYYEPANVPFHGEIEIDRVSHIYRDFLGISESKGHIGNAEGDCHPNVNCPEGNGWRNQINSVACISITGSTGSYLCSGAMINNVRMDKTPYLLSANHCLDGTNCTFKFYFQYEGATCEATDGPFNRIVNGATIIARADLNTSSDFLLLKLTGTISPRIQDSLFFAGWDATGTSSVGAAIHHPGGDIKKISIPRMVTSPGGASNKYWSVYWYNTAATSKGCTEGGSSGSPLFNASGNIIGDLSNGSSACDYLSGTDNYGKFSYSWTNNNNSNASKKLQPWLDPDNTGTKVLYGIRYTSGTGVQDRMPVQTFSIAPNPTSGSVTIKGGFDMQNGICNVYNTMGMLVATQSVDLAPSFNMSFTDLPEGLYFVEIISGNNIYKSKMIINR